MTSLIVKFEPFLRGAMIRQRRARLVAGSQSRLSLRESSATFAAQQPVEMRDTVCSRIRENSGRNAPARPDVSRSRLQPGAQCELGRSCHGAIMGALLLSLSFFTAAALADPPPERIALPVAIPFKWQRAGSCAAQACHGDVRADDVFPKIWGNELTIWIERDPHAQAFNVLSNARSEAMAKALGLIEPAYKSRRCLACHSPAEADAPPADDLASADGVSCEACHGPAEKWLVEHTLRDWRGKSPAEKARRGMHDTDNLVSRAQTCTPCHVGAAARPGAPGGDVDHDLIAAGHPALKFEFSTYLARMPRHWDEHALDPARPETFDPAFEVRAWAVGQAASAQAALALLAHRAAPAGGRPWPEFAEYNCYACHHDLQPAGWRQHEYAEHRDAAAPGLPAWGSWWFPMIDVLAETRPNRSDPITGKLTELTDQMRLPSADRRQLVVQASEAAALLQGWSSVLGEKKFSAAELAALRAALGSAGPRLVEADWDRAAQFYLAVVALGLGEPRVRDDAQWVRSLHQLRGSLMFPTATPRGDPRRYDSPRDFDPRQLAESVDAIESFLKP